MNLENMFSVLIGMLVGVILEWILLNLTILNAKNLIKYVISAQEDANEKPTEE